MGFIGMILVYQAGLQTKRVVPDFTMLGATYLELLVRDLAASIGALMLATRVGAGIAAEIGSMVVTEQVDALRMCAADPDRLPGQAALPREHGHDHRAHHLGGAVAFVAGDAHRLLRVRRVTPQTFFNLQLVDSATSSSGSPNASPTAPRSPSSAATAGSRRSAGPRAWAGRRRARS